MFSLQTLIILLTTLKSGGKKGPKQRGRGEGVAYKTQEKVFAGHRNDRGILEKGNGDAQREKSEKNNTHGVEPSTLAEKPGDLPGVKESLGVSFVIGPENLRRVRREGAPPICSLANEPENPRRKVGGHLEGEVAAVQRRGVFLL